MIWDPPDNPLYPLPADYETLTTEGQRQARVNACRLWLLPGTPAEKANRMVASLNFFDLHYLWPDSEADYDPGFYDCEPLPTPSMHWTISRLWATERLSVIVMPRGAAKSTHCRKDMMLRLVTAPKYSFVYATSTHDNARFTSTALRDQLYGNPRILADWTSEYGVSDLKPSRTEPGGTGVEMFYMTNGSWARFLSVQTRIRGVRPMRFRIDDPEYDPAASTSMDVIRNNMEHLIFSIAIPAVSRPGAGIDWVGTYVSPRHYLWHAMSVTDSVEGPRAADPRFEYWARLFVPAAYEDPNTGELQSCWEENWPVTEVRRKELGLTNALSLERLREIMGANAFAREMMGKPSAADDAFFQLDPLAQGRHAYWYENVDPLLATNPRLSTTKICWKGSTDAIQSMTMEDFLKSVRLFITVDSAYTEHAHSDRKVATLMAIARDNTLFVLEMWSERKPESTLLEATLEMADRWRCSLVCVEVVKESMGLFKRFQGAISTRVSRDLGYTHVPRLKDLRPGSTSKVAKISCLDTRFEHNLIKLPLFARAHKPHWNRLFSQIEEFSPEVKDGGLPHDDEIDTVSMSLMIIKGRVSAFVDQETGNNEKLDAIEQILAGNELIPGSDCTYLSGIDPTMLTPTQFTAIMEKAANGPVTPRSRV